MCRVRLLKMREITLGDLEVSEALKNAETFFSLTVHLTPNKYDGANGPRTCDNQI